VIHIRVRIGLVLAVCVWCSAQLAITTCGFGQFRDRAIQFSLSLHESNALCVFKGRGNPRPHKQLSFYRVTGGIGSDDALHDGTPTTLGIVAAYQYKDQIFSFSRIATKGVADKLNPAQQILEYGLLWGFAMNKGLIFGSLSSGISYNQFALRGAAYRDSISIDPATGAAQNNITYGKAHHTCFGFPIQAQAFFTPSSFFAVGILFFADINSYMPNSGIMLCVQTGWF
jgi:hypothetical protein